MSSGLAAGLRGGAGMTVHPADTAQALGSGDVPVLGTPRLVALIEAAAVDAVRAHLDADATSVGTAVDLQHLAPSPVGAAVHAEAVLVRVDDRMLHFEVRAWDDRGDVARGVHTRAVVDRARFLRRSGAGG
jgi:fluoroacetyl-CoA thioesterase